MPACPSELNDLCLFSLYMCYTTIHRVDSTTGVTLNTFSWQQIVLHEQSIRQHIHSLSACLTLQVEDHAKGLKKKITRTMSITLIKREKTTPSPRVNNALFFSIIHVATNHPVPPTLLSYGRCPSRRRHMGRNAKARFHANNGGFCRNTGDHTTHTATLQSPFPRTPKPNV
jgi:hypothetical protein